MPVPAETPASRPDEPVARKGRKVKVVPFVELARGRLQGVASSDSDIERVYCAFIAAGTGAYYSSTNNDRPDAGTAKRIRYLIDEAVAQYGEERVARFMGWDSVRSVRYGGQQKEPAGEVFSRFLNYLRFLEREAADGPIPEMDWFLE